MIFDFIGSFIILSTCSSKKYVNPYARSTIPNAEPKSSSPAFSCYVLFRNSFI